MEAEGIRPEMDQASLGQAGQPPVGVVSRREILELGAREEAGEDGCLAEQRELSRVEPVETAREQGLDRRGRLFESQLRSLPGVGEELLGEERVPAGVFRDPLLELV